MRNAVTEGWAARWVTSAAAVDPVPRQVERNHAYLFVKIGDEIVPDEHRLQITVQQDRAPVSFFGVAHMDGRVACRNEFFNHCRVDFQFSSSSK